MTALPASPAPATAPAGTRARAWPAAWMLVQAALAGVALLALEGRGVRLALACAAMAAPALFGALRARSADLAPLQLAAWTLATGVAVALGGGAQGPLSPYLLMPAVAALALELGAGWAAAAAVVAALGAALVGRPAVLAPAADAALVCACAAISAFGCAWAWTQMRAGAQATLAAPPAVPTPALALALSGAMRERDEALAERDAARDTAAARTRFLAQMSHELRTPLNAIIGFSDIMRARLFGPLPERYGEYAGLIHESGEHLLSMINDVLDLAKTEAGRYELRRSTFDAREALNAALRIVRVQADEAGVDLRASPAPTPIVVDADERALKQMALNLLANALKFTPRGGHVTAAVAAVAGELQLQVADTGLGIAPADLERLGRPFEQGESARGRGGTGLGLSLVRSFAQLHGGDMRIESRVGAGTAVTVRMPVLATLEDSAPA